MRVAIAPAEPQAVFDIRTRWVAQHLASQGRIDLTVLTQPAKVRYAVRSSDWREREAIGIEAPDVDVLVITRPLSGRLVDTIPLLQREGVKVVVDIDDDFPRAHINLPGRHKVDPNVNKTYNWRHYLRACRAADLVTCSSEALRKYAPDHSVVLRNCVPEAYTQMSREQVSSGVTIGWSGAVSAHTGDLDVTHGGVGQAVREALDCNFLTVGDGTDVQRLLGLQETPRETGVCLHATYPYLVSGLDVGIAPLAHTAYNDAKSWLKILEYTALGVPWVASRTPEYELFYERLEGRFGDNWDVPGRLVTNRGRDWRQAVARLLNLTPEERAHMGEIGREYVREHHTVEANSYQWFEAWGSTLD